MFQTPPFPDIDTVGIKVAQHLGHGIAETVLDCRWHSSSVVAGGLKDWGGDRSLDALLCQSPNRRGRVQVVDALLAGATVREWKTGEENDTDGAELTDEDWPRGDPTGRSKARRLRPSQEEWPMADALVGSDTPMTDTTGLNTRTLWVR
jgi:hypothetical protein